jgi:hypothetical protein
MYSARYHIISVNDSHTLYTSRVDPPSGSLSWGFSSVTGSMHRNGTNRLLHHLSSLTPSLSSGISLIHRPPLSPASSESSLLAHSRIELDFRRSKAPAAKVYASSLGPEYCYKWKKDES